MAIQATDILENPYHTQGIVYNIEPSAAFTRVSENVIEFSHASILGTNNPYDFQVFQNGRATVMINKDDTKILSIPVNRAGINSDIDIAPVISWTATADNDLFYSFPTGTRAKIEIDEATESDFASYKIYQSYNGGAYAVIATNIGIENNLYITAALTAGTYSFKYTRVDLSGNESEFSAVKTRVIGRYVEPTQFTGITYTYSTDSERLTIRGSIPAGQTSQVVGYAIYANYLPVFGLQNKIVNNKWYRYDTIITASAPDYTTPPLYAGNWIFAITPITKYNIECPLTPTYFTLARVDGVLTQTTIAAEVKQPLSITATAGAGGTITVTVTYDYVSGQSIKLYENGILIDTQAKTSAGTIDFVLTRTDGATYYYEASALGGIESDKTYRVYATADATPPTVASFSVEVID